MTEVLVPCQQDPALRADPREHYFVVAYGGGGLEDVGYVVAFAPPLRALPIRGSNRAQTGTNAPKVTCESG